jgi:hypothetical protein
MSGNLTARLRALTKLSTPLSTPPAPAPTRPSATRRLGRIAAHTATIALMLSVPTAAYADTGTPMILAVADLPTVIGNIQTWVMGILAAVATLFLVLAGVYWATAGGDPAQVERAKGALRNALIGYALAVLAPVLLQVVKGIVGG